MAEPIMKHLPNAKAFVNAGLLLGWLRHLNPGLGSFDMSCLDTGDFMFVWIVRRDGQKLTTSQTFDASTLAWADPREIARELDAVMSKRMAQLATG